MHEYCTIPLRANLTNTRKQLVSDLQSTCKCLVVDWQQHSQVVRLITHERIHVSTTHVLLLCFITSVCVPW